MKVFSIIGKQKMREEVAPKIIKALEDDGHTVGFIKKTDNISSNSQTKKAVIWGERQSLFYHEEKQTLLDLLELFDEDYVIVDSDEKSNIPKLLMYEEANLENTGNVEELGAMNTLKRRDDLFFTADKDTKFDDVMKAVKEKVFEVLPDFSADCCNKCGRSCRELTTAILGGMALRSDCTAQEDDVELFVDDEKIKMVNFVKVMLKNSVESVAKELDGYKDDADLEVKIKK